MTKLDNVLSKKIPIEEFKRTVNEIQRELSEIIVNYVGGYYCYGNKRILDMLSHNTLIKTPDCHLHENAKQTIINNIRQMEQKSYNYDESDDENTNELDKYVKLNNDNFKNKFIELTNYIFDKMNEKQYNNHPTYYFVKILQHMFEITLCLNYFNNREKIIFMIFNNVYHSITVTKTIDKIKTLDDIHESINETFANLEHAYTIFKCNTNKDTTEKLNQLCVVKKLFDETICELHKVPNVHLCDGMDKIHAIMEIKMEIVLECDVETDDGEDSDDYCLTMFDKNVSIRSFVMDFIKNPYHMMCLKTDYAMIREKFLFVVIHDVETNQETVPDSKCKFCFADSYISFNVIKFL